ncbi:hypothetical protein GRS96_12365 [Rathayibacter sp. VKM Ac-2803]|uniref:hypothetical protein n=1 Tax=Rathayibacter sp. VKM Ac-2803 TaxID=2609256 RepID=UPI00135B0915|nr:hypothetical protein [Rathayibacter sp. VKM Ac-2803]MWV50063.1 hypothetical protein [Rathayibacter sp. VKM Ac-2803]
MTDFFRVRSSTGPRHEFDAPASDVRARPSAYVVLDETPVPRPRPPKYVIRPARSRRRPKSVGTTTEGDA